MEERIDGCKKDTDWLTCVSLDLGFCVGFCALGLFWEEGRGLGGLWCSGKTEANGWCVLEREHSEEHSKPFSSLACIWSLPELSWLVCWFQFLLCSPGVPLPWRPHSTHCCYCSRNRGACLPCLLSLVFDYNAVHKAYFSCFKTAITMWCYLFSSHQGLYLWQITLIHLFQETPRHPWHQGAIFLHTCHLTRMSNHHSHLTLNQISMLYHRLQVSSKQNAPTVVYCSSAVCHIHCRAWKKALIAALGEAGVVQL